MRGMKRLFPPDLICPKISKKWLCLGRELVHGYINNTKDDVAYELREKRTSITIIIRLQI